MGGLVAHLHPFYLYAVVFQQLERLASVLSQGLLHLLIVHVLPCGGDVLLAGVGPPVAVVEVNHDGHVLQLGTQGHLQHVLFAA